MTSPDRRVRIFDRDVREAHRTLRRALDSAGKRSARFQVGAAYHPALGWRLYHKVGDDSPAFLQPAVALAVLDLLNGGRVAPAWQMSPATLARMLGDMRKAAQHCLANPPPPPTAVVELPSEGRA
jgi:hypothetical protein